MNVDTFIEKVVPVISVARKLELPFLFHADETWSYLQIGELYLSNESWDMEVFEAMINIGAEDYL